MKKLITRFLLGLLITLSQGCDVFKTEKQKEVESLNVELTKVNDQYKDQRFHLNSEMDSKIFTGKTDDGLSIIVYYDAECSVCFQQLEKWKELISYYKDLNETVNIKFVLYTEDSMRTDIYLDNISFPKSYVVYDENYDFLNRYRYANEKAFNTMLLNKDNQIEFIGSPLVSSKIKAHFGKEIKEKM